MATPATIDHPIDTRVSQSVGMKRSPITSSTAWRVAIDRPRRKCTALFAQIRYCDHSGPSSPISTRIAAMSAGVASGPATSRAGSPGSAWTKPKTKIETATSTGMVPASRRAK